MSAPRPEQWEIDDNWRSLDFAISEARRRGLLSGQFEPWCDEERSWLAEQRRQP